MQLKQIWDLIRKSISAWVDDYAPSMGAALAYYTLFSIAPLLVSAAIAAFGKWWNGFLKTWEPLFHAVNIGISFAVTTG